MSNGSTASINSSAHSHLRPAAPGTGALRQRQNLPRDETQHKFCGNLTMSFVPHIPALRRGKVYESLEQAEVRDYRNGAIRGRVSQVHGGIIRKDLQGLDDSRAALKALSISDLVGLSAKAG